nr:RNA-directed DNA polymerase, eukaryota, reverse transcriptase zinc-binding domain protein [Tanacetum cinerariifolium]
MTRKRLHRFHGIKFYRLKIRVDWESQVFFALNRAFLFKWVWRFISKDDSMWYKVISAIHGPSLQSSSRSILNKSNRIEIIQELNSLKSKGIDIMSHCKKKVANGRHTSFWNERWYGDILFKEKFPRIYALENCKDVSVAVKFSSVGDIQNYRKEPRDGVEKQQLTEMNLIMNQICLATTNDRWSWDLNDEGSFVVKDMCNLIDDFMLPKEENKTRWIKYIPIKVNIFAWKVRLNRLPSRINLSRRVRKPVDHTVYRSMIGSLMYVTSSRPDIMFATCLWYPKDFGFDLAAYSDADHAGCNLDRKTESEYVAGSGCCAQVLWMRTQLTDYGFFYDKVPIYCDSKSAIAISCNLVQHTRTKHIDVRYHFIKDNIEKGTIELYFVGIEKEVDHFIKDQLADLFTKSLPEAQF